MSECEVESQVSTSPNKADPLVCRRVVRSGVVVASLHPVIGPVYWDYIDNSDCNAADSFWFTDDIKSAVIFKSMSYRGHSFSSFRAGVLGDLYDEDAWDDEENCYRYSWPVLSLSERAQCSLDEFTTWMAATIWVEYPAPATIAYLADLNGFVGYSPEWTKDLHDALHWSHSTLKGDDLDDEIARSLGELIPLSVADQIPPIRHPRTRINHALEADYAYTMHRLGLREPGRLPWGFSYYEEKAWAHAGLAGVEYVMAGDNGLVSGHIAAFPDLMARFEMGAALARHKSAKIFSPVNQPN